MRLLLLFLLFGLKCHLPSTSTTGSSTSSSMFASESSEWLKNVKTTRRINGGRYADLVVDAEGNSYIACFEKRENGEENLLIVKTDRTGKKVWEIGQGIPGRAYGITFDDDGNLWVTGTLGPSLAHRSLRLIEKGNRAFLMKINQNGQILKINYSQESATGYNITISSNQNILVTGVFDSMIRFDDKMLKGNESDGFAALFDKNGSCKWITLTASDIKSLRSQDGTFYLTGAFNGHLTLGKYTLKTESSYDSDVFIARMFNDGTYDWVKQIGSVGNEQVGYRSSEAGEYFAIDSNRIELFGSVEGEVKYSIIDWSSQLKTANKKGVTSLFLMNLSKHGFIFDFKILVQNVRRRSVSTIAKDNEGNYYITGIGQDSCIIGNQVFRSPSNYLFFVAKFNEKHELQWVRHSEEETDALVRSIQTVGNEIYMTGHYRNQFQFDSLKRQAGNLHELFLMKLNNDFQQKK